MKRLLVVLCVLLVAATAALAEIEITEQPESQTVEAGGNVTFTVGALAAVLTALTYTPAPAPFSALLLWIRPLSPEPPILTVAVLV